MTVHTPTAMLRPTPLLQVNLDGDGRRLRLAGEVDVSNADDLRDALVRLAREPGDLVLDLAGIQFMDLAGCRALECAARELTVGRLLLSRPSPALARLFAMVALLDAPNIGIAGVE